MAALFTLPPTEVSERDEVGVENAAGSESGSSGGGMCCDRAWCTAIVWISGGNVWEWSRGGGIGGWATTAGGPGGAE